MAQEIRQDRHLVTLDRDLRRFGTIGEAAGRVSLRLAGPGLAFVFIVLAALASVMTISGQGGFAIPAAAAALGAYMALNIGANDVANNMGLAVGANALTMTGAIALAAVCETAGALIAGRDVVSTVAGAIVAPESLPDTAAFIRVMMAAILASALWVNLATWIGAPVSTTHAVVGGVVGAGAAAAGVSSVDWGKVGVIAMSWVASPLLGALVAAAALWFIKSRIIYREDKIAAARLWVPILVGAMGGAFTAYLATKGLGSVLRMPLGAALATGMVAGLGAWAIMVPVIRRQSEGAENRNRSLKPLFRVPLIVSAALLSFAHGANDVANAIGPVAAIIGAWQGLPPGAGVPVPPVVMLIGALGISLGLLLFGPRLIRVVGDQITKLNPMRAFCVALSASLTVIIASALGLPVSSTHIAIGAVFGVGFFREWYAGRRMWGGVAAEARLTPDERKARRLVRRSHVLTIVTAWVVTVPASAGLAALSFLALGLLTG